MLTAYHCTDVDVRRDIVVFNFQAQNCSDRDVPMSKQTAQGLKVLAQDETTDFSILEVEECIPGSYRVYMAGWSALLVPPVDPVGIHHPSTDIKKISLAQLNCTRGCWNDDYDNRCRSGKNLIIG